MIRAALDAIDGMLPGPPTHLWRPADGDPGDLEPAAPAGPPPTVATPEPGPSGWTFNTPTTAAGLGESAVDIRPTPGGASATLRFRRDGSPAPVGDGGESGRVAELVEALTGHVAELAPVVSWREYGARIDAARRAMAAAESDQARYSNEYHALLLNEGDHDRMAGLRNHLTVATDRIEAARERLDALLRGAADRERDANVAVGNHIWPPAEELAGQLADARERERAGLLSALVAAVGPILDALAALEARPPLGSPMIRGVVARVSHATGPDLPDDAPGLPALPVPPMPCGNGTILPARGERVS